MFDENLYQETISALHASEDTLSEVMNMTHKTKRRGRLRTTAVLAAVIAILCCMAAAAAALGLDQRLAEYFGATAEQEELLSTAAVPMNIVKRDSGAVMRIEQVIADRYCAAVLIDFTAPEGEVSTAIRHGKAGRARLRAGSNRPSACSRAFSSS